MSSILIAVWPIPSQLGTITLHLYSADCQISNLIVNIFAKSYRKCFRVDLREFYYYYNKYFSAVTMKIILILYFIYETVLSSILPFCQINLHNKEAKRGMPIIDLN